MSDSPTTRSGRRPSPLLAGAATLAALAVTTSVLATRATPPSPARGETSPARPTTPTVYGFDGGYGTELGPDGLRWRWLSDEAVLRLPATPAAERWIAFRALSHRRARTMLLSGPGAGFEVVVGTAPATHLIGPLERGAAELRVRPQPGAERGPGADQRRLSVFVSDVVGSGAPIAAVPQNGFWPTEAEGGLGFNWLRQDGVVGIIARPGTSAGYVAFDAQSPVRRRLTVRQTGVPSGRWTYQLAPGRREQVVLGPVRLQEGRARLVFHANPGPAPVSREDARPVAVKIRALRAHLAPG